ncbi:C40 family peptidase [Streptomyces sp. NRRL S-813]|uniref:C40 family peptidase n=1 Tax=Streptomyces sp. NRRL S-813 TaxID=1463919 RepID=UPI0006915DD2|nr:C40 family peptidase [Streptomyces sp. NRRL S-813]
MAPERISRSGGTGLPGPRDSSPSTARNDDGPSRAEVQRRVSSLYDRAETATGNYNATRAMNQGRRTRVSPAPQDASGLSASALDGVARRWFDTARAQLGPSVPAALPPDRTPRPRPRPVDSPTAEAGSGPGDGSGGLPALGPGARPGAASPLLELTAGPATPVTPRQLPEPTTGLPAPAPATAPASAPASGVRSLPAAPTPQPSATPGTGPEVSRALSGSVARPPQPALRPAKDRLRGNLSDARDLLSRQAAALQSAPPAVEARPAEEPWPTTPQDPWPASASEFAPAAPEKDPALAGPYTWADAGANIRPDAGVDSAYDSGSDPAYDSGSDSAAGSAYERKAARALAFARAQIGRPCVWGATGPGSYDCSSLTQAAWRVAGVALPRTAQQQAASGTAIDLAELRPGDLVFFYGDAGHVGLYTGNGTMVHAATPGASIREESIFFAGPQAIHGARRPA